MRIAETQAEVLDQTISLLRSMKNCCNIYIHTRDKEYLDSIAGALDVLIVLRRGTVTPSSVAADSVTIDRQKRRKSRKTISQNDC